MISQVSMSSVGQNDRVLTLHNGDKEGLFAATKGKSFMIVFRFRQNARPVATESGGEHFIQTLDTVCYDLPSKPMMRARKTRQNTGTANISLFILIVNGRNICRAHRIHTTFHAVDRSRARSSRPPILDFSDRPIKYQFPERAQAIISTYNCC